MNMTLEKSATRDIVENCELPLNKSFQSSRAVKIYQGIQKYIFAGTYLELRLVNVVLARKHATVLTCCIEI